MCENSKLFMTKSLSKKIMQRTRLRNCIGFLKILIPRSGNLITNK